ncbi:hypothetical protein Celaphus_00009839 [Cervus elaphus hippelaphus]|uniref:Rho guanine nucleotide exchange factor 6/7 coiled-coil domain-containing protein n=1 Tax=Cervus elaphus hippelaphus TaxID=46360 RepID=A0A212C0Z1_CEREH|nr:hypothetical protein Celaphus_00009839 [Cervus elaphus hippelaphus]
MIKQILVSCNNQQDLHEVLVQTHEWLAEVGGQHENAQAAGTLHLHELSQLLTVLCENADRGRIFSCKDLEKLVRKVLKNMNDPAWDETNL